MSNKVYAFIPARSNSKRVPGKNIRLLRGKPLIYYTIKAALASEYIDQVFLSSDSEKICEMAGDIAYKLGQTHRFDAFIRPKELAMDHVQTDEVFLHMLRKIESIDAIPNPTDLVLLAPTSPTRTTRQIDAALSQWFSVLNPLRDHWASLVSVQKHMGWFYGNDMEPVTGDPVFRPGTQWAKDNYVYKEDGSIYVVKAETLSHYRSYRIAPRYLHVQTPGVDVDTEDDWAAAERAMTYHES